MQQQQPYQQPRPYAWKSDEYKTSNEARGAANTSDHVLTPSRPIVQNQYYAQAQMTYRGPQDMSGQYRCPHCGTNFLPVMDRRISSAGWITFSLLLVFTLVFFWIGLLMKEDVPICPICKRRIG
ncbi:MAG: LITAF-like zinc ribbon domain-containing protein [Pyrinomonadaceae bacterium]